MSACSEASVYIYIYIYIYANARDFELNQLRMSVWIVRNSYLTSLGLHSLTTYSLALSDCYCCLNKTW